MNDPQSCIFFFFFFNDTATTEIYTLSLHDALPIRPGAYVVATVRRPGTSIYGKIGLQDFTTDDVYYERGINLLHGYLTERYVEDYRYVVALPASLAEVGVLLEPMTVFFFKQKTAYEIQRRLRVW